MKFSTLLCSCVTDHGLTLKPQDHTGGQGPVGRGGIHLTKSPAGQLEETENNRREMMAHIHVRKWWTGLVSKGVD